METGGLVIYHMKLETGHFCLPDIDIETKNNAHKTSWSELVLMVQGLSPSGYHHQKRWKPKNKQ